MARELGDKLASITNSLLAQTLGHSVLLYKEASPPGKVTRSLKALLTEEGSSADKDSQDERLVGGG